MQLFGLEGSGFVLSLGITLLLSGAIMFYVLKRFSYIEASIIQNAKILQSFISEMENNKFGANETAIQSAKFQAEKIYVSDNDLTESESDSDADSDTDSNADSNADADSDADADADAHTDADAGAVPHADVDSELHGNHGTGSDIQEIENRGSTGWEVLMMQKSSFLPTGRYIGGNRSINTEYSSRIKGVVKKPSFK